MLEMIFSGMLDALAGVLDIALKVFVTSLGFDVTKVVEYAPIFPQIYDILQWVALGTIVAIAIFQFGKFFVGNLSETKDTPIHIITSSIIAAVLVYWGNFFLQLLYDLCSYPMAIFSSLNHSIDSGFFNGVADAITGQDFSIAGAAVGGLVVIVLALILVVVIGWNVLKLLLEAVERWLVLCVLTYTSPLAYATMASRSTRQIFSKWVSMVIGQCILLWANVWSIKIMLSILSNMTGGDDGINSFLLRAAIAVAFARIAQQFDSYLQQLGVNAATTGGNLLDTMMATAATIGGIGRFAGKSDNHGVLGAAVSHLGENVKSGNVLGGFMYGGAAGAAAAAAGKAKRSVMGDMSAGEYVRSKVAGFAKNATGYAENKATQNGSPGVGGAAAKAAGEFAYAAAGGKESVREQAQNAGRKATADAIAHGASVEDATKAGMNAYDNSIRDNGDALSSLSASGMNYRDEFQQSLDAEIPEMRKNQAETAGIRAAEMALREGRSVNEAHAAAMAAYSATYGAEAKSGAPIPNKDAFSTRMNDSIPKMQDGASRMRMDTNGAIHNGYGEQINSSQLQYMSNESLARMISGSANKNAVEDGMGIEPYVRNPDPNAFGADGIAVPGQDALVQSDGTQMARKIIEDRGADVADAVLDNNEIINSQPVSAAVLQNSSMNEALAKSDEYRDMSKAISSMNKDGVVPPGQNATGAEITNLQVGHGGADFEYKPVSRKPVTKEVNGESVTTFETVNAPVERISLRTQQAFENMKPAEQAKYHRIGGRDGAASVYVRRTVGNAEDINMQRDYAQSDAGHNGNRRNGGGSHKHSHGRGSKK